MPNVSIPRMTRPWKVVAATMAVFGFVYGYVGTAGAPYCGSMGTCLQRVVDRGLAGFAPASLIPGAIGAVVFAAVVYVVFLLPYGVRKALHRQPSAPVGRVQSPRPDWSGATPAPAVRNSPKQWPRPTPLLVAAGAALVWAIMSVGPARLTNDFDQITLKDTVTRATCPLGSSLAGWPTCVELVAHSLLNGWVLVDPITLKEETNTPATCPPLKSGPSCFSGLDPSGQVAGVYVDLVCGDGPPDIEDMCHERSGGTVGPLMDDVVRGGQAGLLAFLAVGAALLLWPRLRAASL
jgi:hypothetical protein